MKKTILNKILNQHSDIESIEKHIISSYVKNKRIDISRSNIISKYFSGFIIEKELDVLVSELAISSLKELENYLELMIPKADRKLNGAFFTPTYIVDYIINEIDPQIEDKNLDPSCGCGAFLLGLIQYYHRRWKKNIRSIVKDNIFGADILEYNIHRTKILISLFALQNGEFLEDADFNLYVQDSLKSKWKINFDNVLGNPPYIKFQDLSGDYRRFLSENWQTISTGTFNIYFAFFELGYNLLKPQGKLGYITPNNYFTSIAGESLRVFFQNNKSISKIVDFSHYKVFDAQTYTAITFLNKERTDEFDYDRINEKSPQIFLHNTNFSIIDKEELNPKKWRLLKTNEKTIIDAIETTGTQIGDLFDISVGIATLKDEIYFVDGAQERDGIYSKFVGEIEFEIEKDVTKPLYKISDFKNQRDVQQNLRRIIFPYEFINGSFRTIEEKDFKIKFPKCYDYLSAQKEILASRDKGKKIFSPFYMWGRSQGLNKKGVRIITPTFSQMPRFLYVNEEVSFFTNGYGLFFTELNNHLDHLIKPENIKPIQKILNSSLMHFYVTKTSVSIEGGYPCYQKNFIEKFTIPTFNSEEVEILRSLEGRKEIDIFLIDKYGLNLFKDQIMDAYN